MKKVIVFPALVALACFVVMGVAFGVEVPPISVTDFDGPSANIIWEILAGHGPLGLILFGIVGWLYAICKPLIQAWIKARVSEEKYNNIAALGAVAEMGVIGVKQIYSDAIKKAAADGKLTEEEAANARQMAIDFMVDYFKAHGVDIIKKYGLGAIGMVVESALSRMKMGNNPIAKVISIPLPDLSPSGPSV